VATSCQRHQLSGLSTLLDALPRDSDRPRYLFGGQGPAVFLDESAPCIDSAHECGANGSARLRSSSNSSDLSARTNAARSVGAAVASTTESSESVASVITALMARRMSACMIGASCSTLKRTSSSHSGTPSPGRGACAGRRLSGEGITAALGPRFFIQFAIMIPLLERIRQLEVDRPGGPVLPTRRS
jgi:hypothetical protein